MSLNIAQQFMKEMVKNYFGLLKGEILNKLKSRGFLASGLSTYHFSTLYTALPHNLIKAKLTDLIEQTLNRECSLYLAYLHAGGSDFRLYDGSDLKTYLLMRW